MVAVFRFPEDELAIPLTGTEDELCELLAWLVSVAQITVVRVEQMPRRTHDHFPRASLDTARMGAGVCGAVSVLHKQQWKQRAKIVEAIKSAWTIMACKVQPQAGESNG